MTNNSSAESATYLASLIINGTCQLTVGEAVQDILSFINDSPYPANVSFMEEVLKKVCDACESDRVVL